MKSILFNVGTGFEESYSYAIPALLGDMQESAFLQLAKVIDPFGSWPENLQPQLRKNATILLERLRRRNRILNCEALRGIPTCLLNAADCQCEVERASHYAGTINLPSAAVEIKLDSYIGSAESIEIRKTDYSITNVESEEYWEQTILRPLFLNARKVTFVDRLLGAKWLESATFRSSFEWLLKSLRSQSSLSRLEKTSLFTTIHRRDYYIALKALCDRFDVSLENRAYSSGGVDSLPHARYIISDAFGLRIDQGLDLLTKAGVTPSRIALEGDPASTIAQCMRAKRVTAQ